MMRNQAFTPDYRQSWALLIGVDDYRSTLPPLNTAVKGARGLADVLETKLGFDSDHIILLTNEEATQRNIRRALTDPFSRLDKVGPDDRVVIYFAGHGITFDTAEGEVGCVAPADVERGYIDTTIPMDELTRLANRIHAKHVLFLLDACFSGFATTRDASSGVERQVADFLTRPARQVITAGTREQAVSDYWGPGGHSLFTGFLIEGLGGSAPAPGGVMRAFHLAGYLQDQVAQHSRSLQTPQYAALIGSQGGDFIFGMRRIGEISPAIRSAAESSDPAQRLLAVGRLRALARSDRNAEQAAHALARLENIAANDADPMVRSSARAALSEIMPETYVAPVVREDLAGVATHGEALEKVGRVADTSPQEAIPGLTITGGPSAGRHLTLGRLPFTIGRTTDCSLLLDDDKVSRSHAQIVRRKGALWLVDQNSTNGTLVNGSRLAEPHRLQEGDVMTIGRTVIVYSSAAQQAVEETPTYVDTSAEWSAAPAAASAAAPAPAAAVAPAAVPAADAADDAARKRKKRNRRILIAIVVGFLLCACVGYLIIDALANSMYYY